MSLWHKSISELVYADIDAFCNAKLSESARLDYKLSFPGNLEKTIAAFANTVGGLILLGVGSDPKTNQPIWPPVSALPFDSGLQERVYQKATEAIHPPVRVSVSPVIEVPSLPGQCVVVIRVDESKDAPHAVAKGREVYVYERSDNKTDPIRLAHIERIEYLLNRRRRIEEERDEIRSKAIARVERLITSALKPLIWASIIPVYPWRHLCRPSVCYDYLRFAPYPVHGIQRIPDGAIFISRLNITQLGDLAINETITCDIRGHFLYLRGIIGVTQIVPGVVDIFRPSEMSDREYPIESIKQRFGWMFDAARKFYQRDDVERPGLLSVKIGMSGINNIRIYKQNEFDASKRFLDDQYEDEIIISVNEFLSDTGGTQVLFDRITYAFDVMTPEGQ